MYPVLRKQERFNTYIQEHHSTLVFGKWLSFTEDPTDSSKFNVKIYDTYQAASREQRNLPGWYCDQYRGLDRDPDEIDMFQGQFYKSSPLRSTSAYIGLNICLK